MLFEVVNHHIFGSLFHFLENLSQIIMMLCLFRIISMIVSIVKVDEGHVQSNKYESAKPTHSFYFPQLSNPSNDTCRWLTQTFIYSSEKGVQCDHLWEERDEFSFSFSWHDGWAGWRLNPCRTVHFSGGTLG